MQYSGYSVTAANLVERLGETRHEASHRSSLSNGMRNRAVRILQKVTVHVSTITVLTDLIWNVRAAGRSRWIVVPLTGIYVTGQPSVCPALTGTDCIDQIRSDRSIRFL